MPTYSYSCPSCGSRYERILPVEKRDEQSCDICNNQLKRKFEVGMVYAPTCGRGLA